MKVVESQPAGYASVSDKDGGNHDVIGDVTPVAVTAGETNSGNDFVEIQYGSITGTVRRDVDNNGSGDQPLADVVLYLLDSSGNSVDGDPVAPGIQPVKATTGTDGSYLFANVLPASYQVFEFQPSGYASVSDVDGGNPDLIGNITPLTVVPGQHVTGRDFVDVQLGAISGYVYVGTAPLAGVTITLLDASGNPVDGDPSTPGVQTITTVTDANGFYTFTGVTPGTYQVGQTRPFGYNNFGDADGGNLDVVGDVTPVVVLPGQTNTANNFILALDTCPDNWAEWKFQHPGESAGGNPDGDAYDNFAEFAFAMPYDSGVGSDWLDHTAWIIRPDTHNPDLLEGVFVRPKGAPGNVTYSLQYAAALGNPTVWQTKIILPLMITTEDNGDCTETVTIHDLETLTELTGGEGFVRIQVDLAEDPQAQPPVINHTSYTEVEGWKETALASCRTYNNPLLRESVFTGTVDASNGVNGSTLNFTNSAGSVDLATLLAPGVSYYLEVTAGDNVGQRFDVVSASGSAVTLATDSSVCLGTPPFNTLTGALPVTLAGDKVMLRRHWTLGELFLPGGFHASNDPELADQVLTFAEGVYTTYWLDNSSGSAKWMKFGEVNDQAGTVLAPGHGMFVNKRSAATSLLAYGEVRANNFVRPLCAGMNLVGGGYPLDQAATGAASRQMTFAAGFLGTRNFKTADSFFVWKGDASSGTSGYDTYYLLDTTPIMPLLQRWVKVGDANLNPRDAAKLMLGDGSAFIRVQTDLHSYSMPNPWT
ncbi:MAG: SpaA isopeptide-forming pilin-related protein, partial [Verrucomicrobia bacterium]|nr:SpaA isopeptide-forming pilin-related protein [Verrucomicrobiota bacterium]